MEEQLIWCWFEREGLSPLVGVMPFSENLVWAAAENKPEWIYFFGTQSEVPEGVIA